MNIFLNFLLIFIVLPRIIISQRSLSSIPCSTKNYRTGKIVGGLDANRGETPYIASLTRRGGNFCGATILNENWLLTAAHCVCNGLNKIFKPNHIQGVLGLYKISDYRRDDSNSISDQPYTVDFKRIVVHPGYECGKRPANDIALLELSKSIEFSDNVRPMCIATDNSNRLSDVLATVSGWGWTNEDHEIGDRADVLQKATVRVWTNENCQNSFTNIGRNNLITETQLCAGYKNGGIDACWADSGGPLIAENNILIGVVSTGVGCARPGLPGIYTRVSEYTNWIENVIKS